MKKLLLYLLFIFCCKLAPAQYFLRGEVKNESKIALANARIFVHSQRIFVYTGPYGSFGANCSKIKDSLTIVLDGYESKTVEVVTNLWQDIELKKAAVASNVSKNVLASYTKGFEQGIAISVAANNESYFALVENDFKRTEKFPTTGFSLNVNKASYSNVRRFINMGNRVPKDAVKAEEIINYFNLCYEEPPGKNLFNIKTQVADCPWQPDHHLMYVNVNAKKLDMQNVPPGNFVFLIDVSGSMELQGRLALIKAAFQMFVQNLRPIDQVSIVTYGGSVLVSLPPTSGAEKKKIIEVIEGLEPGGDTPGEVALLTAYKLAEKTFVKDGNNRVILATDGDFNVGEKAELALQELVIKQRRTGVYLTCLGVGMGNLKDSKLQALAKYGNGNYAYLDNIQEAEKVLVKELTQTLYAVADNVLIQMKFDESFIRSYRLIGFDNKKTALGNEVAKLEGGEVGSGNSMLAIFEIEPTDKYRKVSAAEIPPTIASLSLFFHECGTVKDSTMAYKVPLNYTKADNLSSDLKFATAATMFALKVKDSPYQGTLSWTTVLDHAIRYSDPSIYLQKEFVQQVKKAKDIYEPPKKKGLFNW